MSLSGHRLMPALANTFYNRFSWVVVRVRDFGRFCVGSDGVQDQGFDRDVELGRLLSEAGLEVLGEVEGNLHGDRCLYSSILGFVFVALINSLITLNCATQIKGRIRSVQCFDIEQLA